MATPIGGGTQALQLDTTADRPVSASDGPALTVDALLPLRTTAVDWWRAAGVPQDRLQGLNGWTIQIADLAGDQLGFASAGTIWIDRDAAGHGWFIDTTPDDNSEFPATAGSPAFNAVDLLTVVAHEIGHALGYDHLLDDGVLADALPLGIRRMPLA
jgi:hypothetical protein